MNVLTKGLYSVLSVSDTEAEVLLSDEKHPVFKAHFPSKPIFPGFVHLEIISDVFKIEIIGVNKAKYSNFVLPSQKLIYAKDGNKIKVTCSAIDVANFSLLLKDNIV